MDEPGGTPRPRRRWRRRLLAAGAALAVVVLLAPTVAGWALRRAIERGAAERVDGTLVVDDVVVRHDATASVRGVRLSDRRGDEVLRFDALDVDVGVRALLGGRKDLSASLTGLRATLRRDAEGRWNVDGLLRPAEGAPSDASAEEGDDAPPDLYGRYEVHAASIDVVAPDATLALRDVYLGVNAEGVEGGLKFRLLGRAEGPDGSVGELHVDGVVPDLAPHLRADVRVDGLDLGALPRVLSAVGVALEEGTTLDGAGVLTGSVEVAGADATADLAVDATDLELVLVIGGAEVLRLSERAARLDVEARARAGAPAAATLAIDARGGRARAALAWDAAAERGARILVDVESVAAGASLTPLLARVHPAFAGAAALDGAGLGGLVTARLELDYGEPLPLDRLAGGWAALPKGAFAGSARLRVDQAVLEASPLVGELLARLGRPADRPFDLAEIGLSIAGGRVRYDAPWTWTLDGVETTFTGSVGVAGDLDLAWNVPITERWAGDDGVLGDLVGETLRVPLSGTLTAPRLDWRGALASLATDAARGALEREARERVRDAVEDVLGGEVGERLGGIEELLGGRSNAVELLREADALWDAGERAKARPLYRRLREEFRASPTYLLNRDRIDERR